MQQQPDNHATTARQSCKIDWEWVQRMHALFGQSPPVSTHEMRRAIVSHFLDQCEANLVTLDDRLVISEWLRGLGWVDIHQRWTYKRGHMWYNLIAEMAKSRPQDSRISIARSDQRSKVAIGRL